MAFSLNSYDFYGMYIDEPVTKRAVQVCELDITATAADVALDIGNTAGTFWGDIDATAKGLAAKTYFAEVLGKVEKLMSQKCLEIEIGFLQALADATTKVVLSQTSGKQVINYALHAGEGLLAYKICFMWSLPDSVMPTRASA
ncbi:hypothetical protein [Caudoviricetes sp.]|nr:hypothetical protein [Caudoviricetes sp.]